MCWVPPPVPPPSLPLLPVLPTAWSSICDGGEGGGPAPLCWGPPLVPPPPLLLLPAVSLLRHIACHCRLCFFITPARSMFARTPPPLVRRFFGFVRCARLPASRSRCCFASARLRRWRTTRSSRSRHGLRVVPTVSGRSPFLYGIAFLRMPHGRVMSYSCAGTPVWAWSSNRCAVER